MRSLRSASADNSLHTVVSQDQGGPIIERLRADSELGDRCEEVFQKSRRCQSAIGLHTGQEPLLAELSSSGVPCFGHAVTEHDEQVIGME